MTRRLPSPRSLLRGLVALLAVCAVAFGVSACRVQPGAAAFVGDDRVAEADVAQYLIPTASPSDAGAQSTTLSPRAQVLSTLVASKLVRIYLGTNGGVPDTTALDADRSAAFQLLTGGDFPGFDQFRTVLEGLGFDGSFAEVYVDQIELQYVAVNRSKAASYADLAKVVSAAGPTPRISPRYGTWDAAQLSLSGSSATPDYLTLSTTAAAWTGPAAPGQALLAAVAVMDRLRAPGGCPWDAEQTHESLAPYLVEETYEALDALESGDPDALREELGDVLLQVLFHARIAAETPAAEGGFDVDDVARGLVEKLTRRHPHVFADVRVDDAAEVALNWEQLKQAEKQRSSVTEGIGAGQPALAWAAALRRRSARTPVTAGVEAPAPPAGDAAAAVGAELFDVVGRAVAQGIDPESALRATARAYRAALLAAEAVAPSTPSTPSAG